jgi:hypothetical protein
MYQSFELLLVAWPAIDLRVAHCPVPKQKPSLLFLFATSQVRILKRTQQLCFRLSVHKRRVSVQLIFSQVSVLLQQAPLSIPVLILCILDVSTQSPSVSFSLQSKRASHFPANFKNQLKPASFITCFD